MASNGQRHQGRRDSRRTAAWIVILIIAVFRSTTLYAQAPAVPAATLAGNRAAAAPAEVEAQAPRVLVCRSAVVATGASILRRSPTSGDNAGARGNPPSQR